MARQWCPHTVVSHSVTQWCPHTLIHHCIEPLLIGKLSPGAAEEPRGNYREVFQVIDTVPVREALLDNYSMSCLNFPLRCKIYLCLLLLWGRLGLGKKSIRRHDKALLSFPATAAWGEDQYLYLFLYLYFWGEAQYLYFGSNNNQNVQTVKRNEAIDVNPNGRSSRRELPKGGMVWRC